MGGTAPVRYARTAPLDREAQEEIARVLRDARERITEVVEESEARIADGSTEAVVDVRVVLALLRPLRLADTRDRASSRAR